MKTIEKYEKMDTSNLQYLLKKYEAYLDNGDNILEKFEINLKNDDYQKVKKAMLNYEIDIHLIRMELNKRLWCKK